MKYVMMNIEEYQRTQHNNRAVDRCMIYVIYLASLAVPLYLFRVGIESLLINMGLKGGY